MPFMVIPQTKNNRRRCIKAISENTITAMVVNGFMFSSFLERRSILPIYCQSYSTVLKSISQVRLSGRNDRSTSSLAVSCNSSRKEGTEEMPEIHFPITDKSREFKMYARGVIPRA